MNNETTVFAPADSSDIMITKPKRELQQRVKAETSAQLPHNECSQNFHSAPSLFQNPDQTNFTPISQFGKNYSLTSFLQNQHSEQVNWEQSYYRQDYYKTSRFHPYTNQDCVPQISSNPTYTQQFNQMTQFHPTNQCDKCGFICDSAVQLNEHYNSAHAGSSSTSNLASISFQQFSTKQYNNYNYQNENKFKEEHVMSSNILDLDSQRVFYQGKNHKQVIANFGYSPNQDGELNTHTIAITPKIIAKQRYIYQTETKMLDPDHKLPSLHAGIHMSPLANSYSALSETMSDMQLPRQAYGIQPVNPPSTTLSPIGGEDAKWKSIVAMRPKTFICTACNKWFTSAGHLKRHYNTTLHKKSVMSSGQPDPATMPIPSVHHLNHDAIQRSTQQQTPVANTQSSVPSDNGCNVDYASHQCASQSLNCNYYRAATTQSGSSYTHHQQGNLNLDNHLTNNFLVNHNFQHQVTSHPLNIGNQLMPSTHIPNDNNLNTTCTAITSTEDHTNGEAASSVIQNYHMKVPVSTLNRNIPSTFVTDNTSAFTTQTLPPFSKLRVNSYNGKSVDHLRSLAPVPTHSQLFSGQNLTPNCPNSHVMDITMNNPSIANTATFNKLAFEVAAETLDPLVDRYLPGFAQQNFNIVDSILDDIEICGQDTYIERNQANNTAPITVHKCNICDKVFNKPCYLTQHNKTLHSGAKPFKCVRCGKRFADSPSYEAHYVKHTDNKPFKCSECPKSFNHKIDLRRHMCLHSGCKPFACEHCGKAFIRKDHMVKHIDTHIKNNLRSSSTSSSSSASSNSSVIHSFISE